MSSALKRLKKNVLKTQGKLSSQLPDGVKMDTTVTTGQMSISEETSETSETVVELADTTSGTAKPSREEKRQTIRNNKLQKRHRTVHWDNIQAWNNRFKQIREYDIANTQAASATNKVTEEQVQEIIDEQA